MDICLLHVAGVWMGSEEPVTGDAARGPSAARLGGRTSPFVHPAAFTCASALLWLFVALMP